MFENFIALLFAALLIAGAALLLRLRSWLVERTWLRPSGPGHWVLVTGVCFLLVLAGAVAVNLVMLQPLTGTDFGCALIILSLLMLWIWWWLRGEKWGWYWFARALIGVAVAGLALGMLAVLVDTGSAIALPLLIAAVVVLTIVFFVLRARRVSERLVLLEALSIAAEQQRPLEEAARALAKGQRRSSARQVTRFAEYLEAGESLSMALQRSGLRVSPALRVAGDVGQLSGDLAGALRRAVQHEVAVAAMHRPLFGRLFYLACLLAYANAMLMLVLYKLAPVTMIILDEMEIAAPPMTSWIFSDQPAPFWPVTQLVTVGFLLVTFCLAAGFWTPLPIVPAPWSSRLGSALVLRWLALVLERRQPLDQTIALLAGRFPQRRLRKRLKTAAQQIGRGTHWCQALQAAGVLRKPEAAVLRSAEGVGNLPWAMEAMADSILRRLDCRLRRWTNLLYPVAIAGVGSIVFLIAGSIIFPLIALIKGLA